MTGAAAHLAAMRGRLIVSCQAPAGSPLHDPYVIARMALAAEQGGAAAVRIDGPEHIRAVRALCHVPIVGLHKQMWSGSDVYITPTGEAAGAVVAAGAQIVAVDATPRPRRGGARLDDVVRTIRQHPDVGVLADVSTLEEGLAALDLGVDALATTLSGYTAYSRTMTGPDLELVTALSRRAHVPVVCEGRVRTPVDVKRAFEAGAFAVAVGSAVTGIDGLVRAFVGVTPGAEGRVAHA